MKVGSIRIHPYSRNLMFCSLFCLLFLSVWVEAFAATSIELRQAGNTFNNTLTVPKGQMITLELWADVDSIKVNGISFFVSFPTGRFEVIDQSQLNGTQPFSVVNGEFELFNNNQSSVETLDGQSFVFLDGAVSSLASQWKSGSILVTSFQLRAVSDSSIYVPVTIDYLFIPKLRDTRYSIFNDGSTRFDIRRSVNVLIDVPTSLNDMAGAGVVRTYALHPNYPNPFNPQTTIQYEVPQTGQVSLAVFNLLGQKVATLFNGQRETGAYPAVWNGRNDAGQTVPSGMYIYRIEAGSFMLSRRMLLLK